MLYKQFHFSVSRNIAFTFREVVTHTRLTDYQYNALRDSELSESSITDMHSCHHVSP